MKKFGLTYAEAEASRRIHGSNVLPPPPRQSFWQKLRANFQDPMIKILLVALGVNVACALGGEGEWLESAGIAAAIALATLVSTWSEYSNENAFQALQAEASRSVCKAWREGEPCRIAESEIVVGDALILQAGDRIPADGVLLEGELQVDQAALNGESEPQRKIAAREKIAAFPTDLNQEACVYRGSVVLAGNAVMEARRIGVASLYGALTQELRDAERDSPLKVKLKNLAQKISLLGYSGAALIAFSLLLHKLLQAGGWQAYLAQPGAVVQDVVQALILAIIIIVMAVPEGLPLMIAIVSSLNMRKMLRDQVLVRKLAGIETAGSLNILFTDKTGTITRGKLEVVRFLAGTGEEFAKAGELPEKLRRQLRAQALLNTSASVCEGRIVGGNLTEAALCQFVGAEGSENLPERIFLQPFDSSAKFSAALVRAKNNGNNDYNNEEKTCALFKGAPEKLLPRCENFLLASGETCAFTERQRALLEERMAELAARAMRLLAFAIAEHGAEKNARALAPERLTLVGIAAMRDDVRAEAASAISAVAGAGVQVVMLTGDSRATAAAIAREAGLLRCEEDLLWTSAELAQLSDEEVSQSLPRLRVLARALPLDKLRLVRLAQSRNLVAGMTGDGVNDAPALKRADVGFAMGSGTEVAKEAGDIVIMDDDFSSIKQALLYGRTIYHNIRKFIVFQLTINAAAVAISFLAPFLGAERPLTITQILWVNLVMDTLAALAFGGEPALAAYLAESPQRRDAAIISPAMLRRILLGAAYMTLVGICFFASQKFAALFRAAPDQIYLYTAYFNAFVFMAVANAFNVHCEEGGLLAHMRENPAFARVFALVLGVQVLLTCAGGEILRTAPLSWREWLVVSACAALFLVLGSVGRIWCRKFCQSK